MSNAYSYDLRTKAIEAVDRGERKIAVCRLLKISRNTLDLWLERKAKTGDYQAVTNYQKGCKHKITDWERFAAFVQAHGDKTQAQMAKVWGEGVTQQNISDALKKLGISRKKRPTAIRNATRLSAVNSKSA